MEQIRKNFKMSEFAVSATAAAKGISITIPEDKKPAIRALVSKLLQPICDATGWRDKVNSGYRSPEVNKLVGGAVSSQHMKGEAADNMFFSETIEKRPDGKRTVTYIQPIDVLRKVVELKLDFDQMIAYPAFVHLSYIRYNEEKGKNPNRKQILYNSSYKGPRL